MQAHRDPDLRRIARCKEMNWTHRKASHGEAMQLEVSWVPTGFGNASQTSPFSQPYDSKRRCPVGQDTLNQRLPRALTVVHDA